jgi:hypothetical protein
VKSNSLKISCILYWLVKSKLFKYLLNVIESCFKHLNLFISTSNINNCSISETLLKFTLHSKKRFKDLSSVLFVNQLSVLLCPNFIIN